MDRSALFAVHFDAVGGGGGGTPGTPFPPQAAGPPYIVSTPYANFLKNYAEIFQKGSLKNFRRESAEGDEFAALRAAGTKI